MFTCHLLPNRTGAVACFVNDSSFDSMLTCCSELHTTSSTTMHPIEFVSALSPLSLSCTKALRTHFASKKVTLVSLSKQHYRLLRHRDSIRTMFAKLKTVHRLPYKLVRPHHATSQCWMVVLSFRCFQTAWTHFAESQIAGRRAIKQTATQTNSQSDTTNCVWILIVLDFSSV